MLAAILLILAYILVVLEFIWYFTCTEHKEIPLILVILAFIVSLIPGMNVVMCILNIGAIFGLTSEYYITLKNNWFNRKFLAYRE